MAVEIQDRRWQVSPADFAVRIQIPDLKGLFNRTLVIEPGTRATIIDDGYVIGEVESGAYTFETFLQRLQFWKSRQCTAILTRGEDVVLDAQRITAPSRESVCLQIDIRCTVQIADILQFLQNLLGARDVLSKRDLEQHLQPLLRQATYAVVGQNSIDVLVGPEAAALLQQGLRAQLDVQLGRYGLSFVGLHGIQINGEGLELLRKQAGENWFAERESQLLNAAAQIDDERVRTKAEILLRAAEHRKQILHSDKLSRIQSDDEFLKLIEPIYEGYVLRREELEKLKAGYQERKHDREALRQHVVSLLEVSREREVEELRLEMDHAVRAKALEKEIELTQLAQRKDDVGWRHELERERAAAEEQRQAKLATLKGRWERIREAHEQRRDDSWRELVHQKRAEEVQTEIAVARAEREKRLTLLQAETKRQLDEQHMALDKRRNEAELELGERKSTNQLERLARLQELNAQVAERQKRLEAEMADAAHRREVDRLQAVGGLGTEALIATSNTENAQLLAQLKRQEAEQQLAHVRLQQELAMKAKDQHQDMYQRLNEAEKAKADAVTAAYKDALASQKELVQQMVSGVSQVGSSAQASRVPPAPPPVGDPNLPTWYVLVAGQQAGPFSLMQIQQQIVERQIQAATRIWRFGQPTWLPAIQVPDFASMFAAPPPPPSA